MPEPSAYVSTYRGENDSEIECYRKPLRVITPEKIKKSLTARGWEIVDDDEIETCLIRPSDVRMVIIHHAPACEVSSVA